MMNIMNIHPYLHDITNIHYLMLDDIHLHIMYIHSHYYIIHNYSSLNYIFDMHLYYQYNELVDIKNK